MDRDIDLEVSSRTWNKIADSIHKDGYREGASEGREKTFQKGFNLGYSAGFKNAEKMGSVNGILRVLKELKKDNLPQVESTTVFEDAHKGLCVLCSSSLSQEASFSEKNNSDISDGLNSFSIEEILNKQQDYFDKNYLKSVEPYQTVF